PGSETMATLYHGNHTDENLTIHEGICLVEYREHAERYAGSKGHVFAIEIDFGGLNVVECDGYDRDENDCPADHESFRQSHAAQGVDVLKYEDEYEYCQPHVCYRLISDAALQAAK